MGDGLEEAVLELRSEVPPPNHTVDHAPSIKSQHSSVGLYVMHI